MPPSSNSALPAPGAALSAPRLFLAFTAVLCLAFAKPLYDWVRLAFSSDLYSHTILIPVISGYLIWLRKKELPAFARGSMGLPVLLALFGLGLIAAYFLQVQRGWKPPATDYLCLMLLAFLYLLASGAIFLLGGRFMKAILFPALFLLVIVPFPVAVENGIERFFQHWSADAVEMFYRLTGTSFLRAGQVFQLPGITIQVAQECSGVRSSLVLFITSLLAGQIFLRSNWKRGVFTLAVIPLGIFRNAFRILTISLLCIHVDPNYIHSPIHHRGGPIFFALSLIPFMLLLYWLRKSTKDKRLPGI
jgi:exosortase C (VPDSG-CTERM-specific)